MESVRVLFREASQSVYATDSNRPVFDIAKHFCTFLKPVIQQDLHRGIRLAICRIRLTFGHSAAPNRERKTDRSRKDQAEVS